jgi:hypothetical protein
MIRFVHRGLEDVEPELYCGICQRAMSLKEAWLAFAPVSERRPESQGLCVHKNCLDGAAMTHLQSAHVVLWKGLDVVQRLMRH